MHACSRNGRRALLAAVTLILVGAVAPAAALDPVAVARLMIGSGLLGAAERPRERFSASFETLAAEGRARAADAEQARALQVTLLSTFPPAQVRERWLRELTLRLDPEAFVAARAFFASIPGQSVANALRAGFRHGLPARQPAAANSTEQLVLLTDATTRDLVIDVHAHALALWALRLLAAGEPGSPSAIAAAGMPFEAAFERALEDSLETLVAARGDTGSSETDDDPPDSLPAPYREAFMEFAMSDAGDRFFAISSSALETALRQLARSQAGHFVQMMQKHPPSEPLGTP